jgi:hypothetical protein
VDFAVVREKPQVFVGAAGSTKLAWVEAILVCALYSIREAVTQVNRAPAQKSAEMDIKCFMALDSAVERGPPQSVRVHMLDGY